MSPDYHSIQLPYENLFAHHTPVDGKIYHYCTLSTFEKIIVNKEFWLTETDKMNDFAEGVWLNHSVSQWCEANKEKYDLSKLKVVFDHIHLPLPESYMCCFSTDKDTLSQWRAYAEDCSGCVIGIDINKLRIRKLLPHWHVDMKFSVGFAPVIYTQEEQYAIIESFLIPILTGQSQHNFDLAVRLKLFAPIFKNPAFIEEKEFRLISTPHPFAAKGGKNFYEDYEVEELHISQRDFRMTKKGLSPFFRFSFAHNPSIVTDVVIGSKNSSNPEHIRLFLKKHGFESAEVASSKATYR